MCGCVFGFVCVYAGVHLCVLKQSSVLNLPSILMEALPVLEFIVLLSQPLE